MYMDVAITEYWRDSAMPFAQSFGLLGGDMVVRKASVDFIQSARMDDVLDIPQCQTTCRSPRNCGQPTKERHP